MLDEFIVLGLVGFLFAFFKYPSLVSAISLWALSVSLPILGAIAFSSPRSPIEVIVFLFSLIWLALSAVTLLSALSWINPSRDAVIHYNALNRAKRKDAEYLRRFNSWAMNRGFSTIKRLPDRHSEVHRFMKRTKRRILGVF